MRSPVFNSVSTQTKLKRGQSAALTAPCKWCLVRVLLLVRRLFPLISRDRSSSLCILRTGICFVPVSSLLLMLFRSVTFNLCDLLCSKKKKKLCLAFVRIFLLYPSFSQWCCLLTCICICFWHSYSFSSHRPTQFFLFLGWVVAWVFYSLEPFIAGHPCTEAWLSIKTHISFTCSYFLIFFPTFFLLHSCLYLIPRLLSWVPVSCAVPLLFLFPHQITFHKLLYEFQWNEIIK